MLHPEDVGSMVLQNVGILPQHASYWPWWDCVPSFTSCPICMPTSKPQWVHPEDGDCVGLWNVGILLHYYMMSQPRKHQLIDNRIWVKYSTC